LAIFDQWKDYQYILAHYKIYVYNRPNSAFSSFSQHPNVTFFQAPLLDVSSSFIRQSISEGKDMRHFLPDKVYEYIKKNNIDFCFY